MAAFEATRISVILPFLGGFGPLVLLLNVCPVAPIELPYLLEGQATTRYIELIMRAEGQLLTHLDQCVANLLMT